MIEWRLNQSIKEANLNPFGPVKSIDEGNKRNDALENILQLIRD
jgi:hypothetical protein